MSNTPKIPYTANRKLKIVIDIGGTKTLTRCYISGVIVHSDFFQTDASASEIKHLTTALDRILLNPEIQEAVITETAVIVGSASYTPSTKEEYKSVLEKLPVENPHLNITSITYGNDGEIPLLLNPTFTLSIVAGTGSNIYIRKPDGIIYEFGRFNTFHESNQGSGTKIATSTITTLLTDQHSHTSDHEILLNIVSNSFPDHNPTQLDVYQIVEDSILRQRAAQMAEPIIAEAEKGNQVARTIINNAILTFCETIHNLISAHYPPGAHIETIMTGSVGNNALASNMYEEAFQTLSKNEYRYTIQYNNRDLPYSGFNPTHP